MNPLTKFSKDYTKETAYKPFEERDLVSVDFIIKHKKDDFRANINLNRYIAFHFKYLNTKL